jgi:tartrate-resistant acid phosphatase type 5
MSKSKRWILPSLNYSIDVLTNNGNTHLLSVNIFNLFYIIIIELIFFLKILMLDTSLLCGNTPHDGDEFSEPKFKTLEEEFLAQDYFKSIEKELSQIGASDVPYVLVTGHFPVWSIAEHGPTQCLVDKLRPMLHKYKVSAYLSGHDHNLQHITDDYMNHTCSYIVSGASNFVSNSTVHIDNIPKDSLKFHWPVEKNIMFFEGGFLTVRANPYNMTLTFMQSNGVELYQHIIYPRF